MKKIITISIKAIAKVFAAIDNLLYRSFGVVSSARKAKWHRDAVKIQNRLDEEHILTSVYNYEHCSYLTTKAVMDRIKWWIGDIGGDKGSEDDDEDDADYFTNPFTNNNPAHLIDFSTNKIPNKNTAKTYFFKISSLAFKTPIDKFAL